MPCIGSPGDFCGGMVYQDTFGGTQTKTVYAEAIYAIDGRCLILQILIAILTQSTEV